MFRFLIATILFIGVAHGSQAAEQLFAIDPQRSVLTVNVFKSGALSTMLHDHHFVPEKLSGEVRFDPSAPDKFALHLSVDAASLKDHQSELSEKDVAKVNNQISSPTV